MVQSNNPSSTEVPPAGPTESSLEHLVKNIRSSAVGENEDLAETLIKNWQKLVGAFGVALLCVWVVREYRSAQESKVHDSVTRFAEAQSLFAETFASTEKPGSAEKSDGSKDAPTDPEHANKVKGLEESLQAVESRYPDSVYSGFSGLYSAMAEFRAGNEDAGRKQLSKLGADSFAGAKTVAPRKALTKDALTKEMAALVYARSLEPGANAEARTRALAVARGASFVNVEALLIAWRLSPSTSDKTEVVDTAKALIDARPELGEIVKREMKALGAAL